VYKAQSAGHAQKKNDKNPRLWWKTPKRPYPRHIHRAHSARTPGEVLSYSCHDGVKHSGGN